jgi:putative glutathione S-transferase
MTAAQPSSGTFEREPVALDERITSDGSTRWPVEPGRYRLVVARACPWANRAVIVRRLLGLEPVLSMGIAGPLHDERSWRFHLDPGNRDPVLGIEYLGEAYRAADPDFDAGVTVPAMVEIATGKLATNGFQ